MDIILYCIRCTILSRLTDCNVGVMEHEEGCEKQLVMAHFEWIGDNGAEKMKGNSRERELQ